MYHDFWVFELFNITYIRELGLQFAMAFFGDNVHIVRNQLQWYRLIWKYLVDQLL